MERPALNCILKSADVLLDLTLLLPFSDAICVTYFLYFTIVLFIVYMTADKNDYFWYHNHDVIDDIVQLPRATHPQASQSEKSRESRSWR